ncbi:hypothetical protein [Actinoplanes xinjiangensis]|uniref:hypothetical protein n=1 Tax=Actinoplanes xinjiangensis TaxID=512350 RepID=UPI0011B41284|nr:hypothetical protein [Actinoplanes xinjiangensis]GIF41929.1 hypothetical protein Axi01nite_62400 [Actinoplanes xinjiangensis]
MTDLPSSMDYPTRDSTGNIDATLSMLNTMVSILDSRVGIVLAIPGGMLSGQLVRKATWYKEWFELIEHGGEGAESFATTLKHLFSASGRLGPDSEFIDHSGDYLHVIDGALTAGNQTSSKMPWRVRLDQVAAWSLGSDPRKMGA